MEQDALYYGRPQRTKVKFPNSKHNVMPSNAVDVMPYPIDWNDMNRLQDFAATVKARAKSLGIEVQWGGDWKSFFDGPHWQVKL